MTIGVKVLDRPIEDVSYIRATIKGMAQTFRHLFEPKVTVQYPETKAHYRNGSGKVRCVRTLSDGVSRKLHQADSRRG